MATFTINGNRIEVPDGCPVTISNGSITVGKKSVASVLSGVVEVRWEGPAADVYCDANLTVNGNVEGRVDAGNNVACGNVGGSVEAGNNVACGRVGGSARAGNNLISN